MKKKGIAENFKILSLKEENKLSLEEKKEYYKKYREYVLNRKLTNTTPGATTIAPKLKGVVNKLATVVTKAFTNKNIEWVCEGKENVPNGPVLFAHTHQGVLDGFVWIPNTDRHCLILRSAVSNKFLLLCEYDSGLILVQKDDKENCKNAKLDMVRHLLEGRSITYFPEGAWNLSPNKLHLPMSYGFLDTARKAGVPVVPVIHEYTYDTSTNKEKITKIHTVFEKPIYINLEDSLEEKLLEYQEVISTTRYRLIEENGLFYRDELSPFDYKNYLEGNLNNLKWGGVDVNVERANLFGSTDEFYEFHHINDVPCDEEGNLLETSEVIRLKKINKKHNI